MIFRIGSLERVEGIEPSYSAWKAAALPLSYTRMRRQVTRRAGGLNLSARDIPRRADRTLLSPPLIAPIWSDQTRQRIVPPRSRAIYGALLRRSGVNSRTQIRPAADMRE
jgi:hypothetical protein